jgi:processive 1,2-diacylglycerol beta-glucosyltransferase
LILSASAGTGHVRAAEALRQQLEAEGVRARHEDILELAPRWVQTVYGGGFEMLAARAPWLWREVYERTDGECGEEKRWGDLAARLLFREFRRLLEGGEWGLCLCTHFLPGQLAAGRAGMPPFASVVTDFVAHRYWLQPGVNRFFVATEALAADVASRLPGVRAEATGIPVAPNFETKLGREEARRALGLDPERPVALVMGGGMGLGIEETVRAALRARVTQLQVVAVCGRNEAARAQLESAGIPAERLRLRGFVSDVERYLAAADVVVTKPGGLTTSETLALGRPLLLTRPIPGQEEGNTEALVAAGAALAAPEPEQLERALERVFGEAGMLERLGEAAARIGRPYAAQSIARAVRDEFLVPVAA